MNKVDRYVEAATRENTRRSYSAAVRHFEFEWGGLLPATADSMARYLADYAGILSLNTLRQRLAALAQWHQEQGFPDPTKAPVVRKVLKGIHTLHPAQEKQAIPLLIGQLDQVVRHLEQAMTEANRQNHQALLLRRARDRSLLLLGFWRGFRGDELTRLYIEELRFLPDGGMTCFLAHTKNERQLRGREFKVPALPRLCPVSACRDWINLADLQQGPLFRRIDRWGHISPKRLHINSLIPLLRSLFAQAGLADAALFSSHSLRRGFAGWARQSGWDLKTLMEYVGWKDVKSAMRYLECQDPFSPYRVGKPLSADLSPPADLLANNDTA